jgi:hypothetical protein
MEKRGNYIDDCIGAGVVIFGGSQAFMGSENGLINTYLGRGSKI